MTNRTASSSGAPSPGRFGQDLAAAREALVGFVDNILEARDVLDLGPRAQKGLEDLAAQVRDGRVELALLGMFSSGKSSVVNSLLGIPNDDNRPRFLPTKPDNAPGAPFTFVLLARRAPDEFRPRILRWDPHHRRWARYVG